MTGSRVDHRLRRTLGAVGALLLLVGGVVGSSGAQGFRHGGLSGTPDQLHACGRDYVGPGDRYSRAQVDATGARVVARAPVRFGQREIWGVVVDDSAVAGCGTGVWLRTGTETFRQYALSGGP